MTRITTSLVAAVMAAGLLSGPLYAEPAQPTTVEKIKTMTKSQWSKLRAEWAKDKAKYTACGDKAKADGLKGRKRWASIYDCMTQ